MDNDKDKVSWLKSYELLKETRSRKLATMFDFPDADRMRHGINEAFIKVKYYDDSHPSLPEQRSTFEDINAHSQALTELLNNLSTADTSKLEAIYDEDIDELIEQTLDKLNKFNLLSSIVDDSLQGKTPRRKPFEWFVISLANLWQAEIGDKASSCYDGMSGEYNQPFYNFVMACMKLDSSSFTLDPSKDHGTTIRNILSNARNP